MHYNKHVVQKNETLKSIAALYSLDPDALKLFHNNHCPVKDMILIELTGQKEIYIPRTAVTDKDTLVKLGRGNALIFQPEHLFCKYGVVINIESGDSRNELKYETSVRWLRKENRLHFFEIDRISNLYLNEEEVNEIADTLAYKTSKVLYPLQISVDEQGKFNAVENLSVFKERWPGIKEEVYEEFEGETVDRYCQKIEEIIGQPDAMDFYLKNDYFIRTLFSGIYQSFGLNYQIKRTESFPVMNNPIEPKYEVQLKIDPLKDEYDLVNITGEGKLSEERTIYELINEAPFPMIIKDPPEINEAGSCRMQYYLNGKSQLAESVYFEYSIMLKKEKKISVIIAAVSE
ncbi:hypothetical protein ABXT08_09350 [Chryseobacterium sp. NRRL B-14859]|uniref:hypothetical protein n=1 Tax=Chryseobacterium sp. NRRL B-14859 TaxID=1562763 RepID=UPI00339B569E